MSTSFDYITTPITATVLADRWGDISLDRICFDPLPGTATEEDVIRLHDETDRLYELVDGVLVEKTVGRYEACLALFIGRLLDSLVYENDLGVVLGADGMTRLFPGMIRIPDVSFISWERLPNRRLPKEPIGPEAPNLAVEVLSPSNTKKEMDRKLADYFAAGVELVWYVDHRAEEIRVFRSVEQVEILKPGDTLTGGQVLPEFAASVAEIFKRPQSQGGQS